MSILFSRLRLLPLLSLLALPALAPGQQTRWGPAADAKPTYAVTYTGRLFGYFRYPDQQTTLDSGCPSLDNTPLSPQVEKFRSTLKSIDAETHAPRVLVSMGDNFAPELLARAMRDRQPGSSHFDELVDKDLFTPAGDGWYRDTGQTPAQQAVASGNIPSDNVACFMRLAGINAVVPGEQDFYFGPERLRQLARFLAEAGSNGYQPVHMLAANLVISSTVRNAAPRLPAGALPKGIQEALNPTSAVEIHLPVAVMPWMNSVRISSKSHDVDVKVYDCPAAATNPLDFALPSQPGTPCTQLEPTGGGREHFKLLKPPHHSPNFIDDDYTLDPGDNHAICVVYPAEKTGQQAARDVTRCKLFSVEYPLLPDSPSSPGTARRPYYLSPDGAEGTAVFGVLDPDLIGYVGELEDTWVNANNHFDTHLQITDPVDALRQQVLLCNSDSNCRGRHKILLAQMPYSRAAQLAARIDGFEIVIAQANPQHATGEENSSRIVDSHSRPYLLTPGFAFNALHSEPLSMNLRNADAYLAPSAGGKTRQFFANTVYDPEAPQPGSNDQPAIHSLEAAAQVAPDAGPLESAKAYEQLALTAMQQFCGSDIAMLQKRDIFTRYQKAIDYWPASFRPNVQQLLDEVLWKGDFAFCLPVKGSTLKRVLEESARFDQDDSSELSLEIEKGRGLSTLGLSTDPSSGAAMIRGQAVEDNRLYGVAITDYLAFGDTGYPELSSEAVLPNVRVASLHSLHRLTGLACERLSPKFSGGHCQDQEIEASAYFDTIAQRPFDTSPGLGAVRQFRVWATHPFTPEPVATVIPERKETPEKALEHRGLWWFTVQNASLEYDLTFIRGSDKRIPANFSGINTFAQLATPESSQLGLWTRIRGGYSFPRFLDFYASGEERYTRSAIRQADSSGNGNFGPYQLTLNNNVVRAELGLLSKPVSRRVPLRALVSENLFTQVANPFYQLAAPVPCNAPNCVPGTTGLTTLSLGKNFLVMTRLGARLQNQKSWFEAGREYGQNIGTPVSYQLQDAGRAAPLSCALAGNMSLSQCISADPLFTTESKLLPNLENQSLAGWFLDFHTLAPIYRSKLELSVDSYTELFDKRRTDTSFNTRFYEDLTVALNVPLWGNLTFAPQVEAFFFQNKVLPNQSLLTNHYSFLTSSLKLEYGFDWHRGVGLARALRYPSGVSSAANPITTVP